MKTRRIGVGDSKKSPTAVKSLLSKKVAASSEGRTTKSGLATPRTFTVTLSQQAADSLATFCDEFQRVSPEGLIVDAAEGYLKSCDDPTLGFRYDASLFAANVTERLEEERRGKPAGASQPAFILRPSQGRTKNVGVASIFGDWGQFTFPADPSAESQFLAAAAGLGIEPSRILFQALTIAVEETVAQAAQLGGTAQ